LVRDGARRRSSDRQRHTLSQNRLPLGGQPPPPTGERRTATHDWHETRTPGDVQQRSGDACTRVQRVTRQLRYPRPRNQSNASRGARHITTASKRKDRKPPPRLSKAWPPPPTTGADFPPGNGAQITTAPRSKDPYGDPGATILWPAAARPNFQRDRGFHERNTSDVDDGSNPGQKFAR